MKEFIDKLIDRLEKEKSEAVASIVIWAYSKVIRIVNELAEEYVKTPAPDHPIPIDTQQYIAELEYKVKDKDCSKCSRRSWYQIGYADAEKKFAEEFCEWKRQGGYNFYLHKTSCGTEDTYDDSYKFCPYCGKKIKSN